jgi:hypothetical protein
VAASVPEFSESLIKEFYEKLKTEEDQEQEQ